MAETINCKDFSRILYSATLAGAFEPPFACQVYVVDLGSGMEMIKAGRVRVLGLTTRSPLDSVPGVPPIASGFSNAS